jgi:2-keto-myo-inositol isomerase
MKEDLPTDIAVAAQAGFEALEIRVTKMDSYLATHNLADLRKLFERDNVHPATINSIEGITFRNAAGQEEIKARCRKLCAIAQTLGCEDIVAIPSPRPKEDTWKKTKAESVKVLRELAEIATSYGVKLAFEFLGFADCSVNTLARAWEIVRKVDLPNVGLVIDAFHFYVGGSKLSSIDQVDPMKLYIFHISDAEDRPREELMDSHRLLPGEGVIPLTKLVAHLKYIGFDGLYSVELFRPEYWELDPFELARQAMAMTLRVVSLR